MKVLSLITVYLTVAGFLILALSPNSSFIDDIASLLPFYDSKPPTLTIQMCDGFDPIGNEPLPVKPREQLSAIRVVQSPDCLLDSAFRDALFLARLYPSHYVNLPVFWLFIR